MSNRDVGPFEGLVWDGVSRFGQPQYPVCTGGDSLGGTIRFQSECKFIEQATLDDVTALYGEPRYPGVPILSAVDLDAEQKAFVENFKQALSERVFALLGTLPKIKNSEEGKAVLREAVGEALAEVWPDAFEPVITVKCEPPTEEQRSQRLSGEISVSFMGKPVTGFSEDAFVAASAPTPVMGVPVQHWGMPQAKPSTSILPPEQRGSKKPGGPSPRKAAPTETGYRVLPYAVWMNTSPGDRPGETFSIPDLAQAKARKLAKSEGETYIILRDGVRWMRADKDGALDPLT